MNSFTTNTYEMKREIVNFSKKIAENLNNPTTKFVMDIQYGLANGGNCLISNIAMNLDLMNHGYNPVIIRKEDRLEYYEALDKAHTTGDYTDFIQLIIKIEIEILKKYLELL